jgi:hypothetical protein
MLRAMPSALRERTPVLLGGQSLLARLRGRGADRAEVDPGLAGGLRDWLEDGLSEAASLLPDGGEPLRVAKDAVNQVLSCEALALARPGAGRPLSPEMARGSLVDAVFRQWITTAELADPFADALDALSVMGDPDGVGAFVAALTAPSRRKLADEVRAHAARITAAWPELSPTWMARTQERLVVSLAGGRVVLSGVVDLALGAPSSGRASVCVVEVKSGRRRIEHRGDLHLYALLETLRSGAPPFRVATFYTATGELDVEPVGSDVLLGALNRVLAATLRLCRLAAGAEPSKTPGPWCAWCPALAGCEPGRRRTEGAGSWE